MHSFFSLNKNRKELESYFSEKVQEEELHSQYSGKICSEACLSKIRRTKTWKSKSNFRDNLKRSVELFKIVVS